MSEPIPLHGIYTTVKVIRSSFLTSLQTIQDLEQLYRQTMRRFFLHMEEKVDGVDVANDYQYLNILGSPGSGKTTFLRRMGLEALLPRADNRADQSTEIVLSQYHHECMPVLIELRRLARDGSVDLESAIVDEFKSCGFPESRGFVRRALETGRLLVLLDGLDEVAGEFLDETIAHIRDFNTSFSKESVHNLLPNTIL